MTEPRGCPTPGACSCEPVSQREDVQAVMERLRQWRSRYFTWEDGYSTWSAEIAVTLDADLDLIAQAYADRDRAADWYRGRLNACQLQRDEDARTLARVRAETIEECAAEADLMAEVAAQEERDYDNEDTAVTHMIAGRGRCTAESIAFAIRALLPAPEPGA